MVAGGPASGVVVESGPVVYDDAAAEEEEEEEEEACVSAMELLGSNGQFKPIVVCQTSIDHSFIVINLDLFWFVSNYTNN